MRILLALLCCCSCRQAMATELKKQKPLGRGERGPASPFFSVSPPLQPPLSTGSWPGLAAKGSGEEGNVSHFIPPRPSPGLTWLWSGLHGVLGAEPQQNRSGKGKNAYHPNSQPSDPPLHEPAPSPRLLPREGAMGQQLTAARMHLQGPATQTPGQHPLLFSWT